MRKLMLFGAILGILVAAGAAQADPLPPGTTLGPPAPTTTLSGTVIASIVGAPFVGAMTGTPVGTYSALVVKDSVTGFLDFVYQAKVTKGHANRLSMSSFSGATITDAGYLTTGFGPLAAGNVKPTTIDRSTIASDDGAVVGGNFPIPHDITTSKKSNLSDILVFKTTATVFGPGAFSVIDSGTATEPAFAPFRIPEPSSLALLATGILGLGGYAWRRHKVRPV